MCSKEETKALNNEMEMRILRRLDALHKQYEDGMFKSHNGVSEIVSNGLKEVYDKIEDVDNVNREEHQKLFDRIEKVQPLVEFKDGLLSLKSVAIGLAAVGIAVATIWQGFKFVISNALH